MSVQAYEGQPMVENESFMALLLWSLAASRGISLVRIYTIQAGRRQSLAEFLTDAKHWSSAQPRCGGVTPGREPQMGHASSAGIERMAKEKKPQTLGPAAS